MKNLYGNKIKSGIPPIQDDNKTYNLAIEKADLFNDYFVKQSTLPPEPPNVSLPHFQYTTDARLSDVIIHEEDVLKALKSLKTTKANGPDGIINKILKESATSLSIPLTKLFKKSIADGKFPTQWKKANVTPSIKKR